MRVKLLILLKMLKFARKLSWLAMNQLHANAPGVG